MSIPKIERLKKILHAHWDVQREIEESRIEKKERARKLLAGQLGQDEAVATTTTPKKKG